MTTGTIVALAAYLIVGILFAEGAQHAAEDAHQEVHGEPVPTGRLIVTKAIVIALWPLLLAAAVVYTAAGRGTERSEEHTSELQSRENLVCRLLLEKKNKR